MTYSGSVGLSDTLVHATINRRTWIAFDGRAAALAGEVHIDGEKGVPAIQRLPLRDERLAASFPSWVERINEAWVEAERRARGDLDGFRAGPWVGVAKAESGVVVDVGVADVAAGLAAVGVVDRRNFNERIVLAALSSDAGDEGGERQIGGDHGIIGRAIVVLDFLKEH